MTTGEAPAAPRERSLRANFFALAAGRAVAALAQWGAVIVVAKASDLETVGRFALAQVICIPIAEVARMGLREVLVTDRGEHRVGHYLGLRIVVSLVAFAAMVAVGTAVAETAEVLLVVVLYAGSRVVELLSDIVYGLFQARDRLDVAGTSLALVGVTSVAALSLGWGLTGSLVGAVAGQLVAYVVVFVAFDLRMARRPELRPPGQWRPVFEPQPLGRLARISAPLAVSTILAIVAIEAPRVLVAGRLGTEALGVFAPLFVLTFAPSRLVHSLGTAATTRLAELHHDGDRVGFLSLLGRLGGAAAALGLAGVVVAATVGGWVLRTVYTAEYEPYTDLFIILAVAGALRFVAELVQYGLVAARRFWWLTAGLAVTAVVAVVTSVVLVPEGLLAAGAAVAVVFGTQLAIILFALGRNLPAPRQPVIAASGSGGRRPRRAVPPPPGRAAP